jgi:hypothetical protein
MGSRIEIMTQAENATDETLLEMIDNATDAGELAILESELDFRTARPGTGGLPADELAEIEAAARTANNRRSRERAARARQYRGA